MRRVVLELEGPRHEVDRAVGAFFTELERMNLEARMNEPIWTGSSGALYRFARAGHNIKGTLTIREDIG